MNNTVYDKFKRDLFESLERERDLIVARNMFDRPMPLFEISNENDRLYTKILQQFNFVIMRSVDLLILDLCELHGINAFRDQDYDLKVEFNGKIRFVEFRTSPNTFSQGHLHEFVSRQVKDGMPLLIVFLLKDSAVTTKNLQLFQQRINRINERADIDAIIFEDFLEIYFGFDERLSFETAMLNFNEQMHDAVGYQITEICNSKNRQQLKLELSKELKDTDFVLQALNNSCFMSKPNRECFIENDFKKICENFKSRELYNILLGNNDFCESLLTSEWLYKKYFMLEDLDNTFIVAGYFKSIEQLLWNIIRLLGNGRKLRSKTISEDNYDVLDKALGALEQFFDDSENLDLFKEVFENKKFVVKYFKSQLSEWRKKYRNGYMHKQMLNDVNTVNNIRKETFFLYVLILGCIDLSEENIKALTN